MSRAGAPKVGIWLTSPLVYSPGTTLPTEPSTFLEAVPQQLKNFLNLKPLEGDCILQEGESQAGFQKEYMCQELSNILDSR